MSLAWKKILPNAEWLPLYVIWRLVCGANTREEDSNPFNDVSFLFVCFPSVLIFKCFWHQPTNRKGWHFAFGFFWFFWGSQKANRKYRSISLRKKSAFLFCFFYDMLSTLSLSLLMTFFSFCFPLTFFGCFCLLD